jgi:hypothetical protein
MSPPLINDPCITIVSISLKFQKFENLKNLNWTNFCQISLAQSYKTFLGEFISLFKALFLVSTNSWTWHMWISRLAQSLTGCLMVQHPEQRTADLFQGNLTEREGSVQNVLTTLDHRLLILQTIFFYQISYFNEVNRSGYWAFPFS